MNNDIQTFLKKAGDSACYVLCLLDVAFQDNRPFDLVQCLQTIVKKVMHGLTFMFYDQT